ncbi:hypothetical protein [Lysinibacillus fusiformis]|uniref:hypothetical protein n=1 Tax=Lysinibacillus fusiformis TaxID=28031 RepID=UPI003D0098E6
MTNSNKKKVNENQKIEKKAKEVEIMAPTPCCSNCIVVDPANGCSVVEVTANAAVGIASHAEGTSTLASSIAAHAEGEETRAEGRTSHSEGCPTRNTAGEIVRRTTASNDFSHTEGSDTIVRALNSPAEGSATLASASNSPAEGSATVASGVISHAEGDRTRASASASGKASDSYGYTFKKILKKNG